MLSEHFQIKCFKTFQNTISRNVKKFYTDSISSFWAISEGRECNIMGNEVINIPLKYFQEGIRITASKLHSPTDQIIRWRC